MCVGHACQQSLDLTWFHRHFTAVPLLYLACGFSGSVLRLPSDRVSVDTHHGADASGGGVANTQDEALASTRCTCDGERGVRDSAEGIQLRQSDDE